MTAPLSAPTHSRQTVEEGLSVGIGIYKQDTPTMSATTSQSDYHNIGFPSSEQQVQQCIKRHSKTAAHHSPPPAPFWSSRTWSFDTPPAALIFLGTPWQYYSNHWSIESPYSLHPNH
jgi:hypothetical protein